MTDGDDSAAAVAHATPSPVALLRQLPRAEVVGLVVLLVAAGATEGVGALVLVPLLGLLHGRQAAATSTWSHWIGLPWTLPQALGAFLLVSALAAVLQYFRSVRSTAIQLRWVDRMRARSYEALLRADWRWLSQRRQSDLSSLLMGDIGRIGVGLNAALTLAAMTVSTLGYLAAACVLSPGLGLVVVVLAGVAWRALAGIRGKAVQLGQRSSAASRALHAEVHDNLGGIRLTKVAGAEPMQAARFRAATHDAREQQLDFVRGSGRARGLTQFAGAALIAGFVFLGSSFWALPASELLTLIIIAGRLVPMLSSGQQNLHLWLNALPAWHELDQLLAECEAVAEPDAGVVRTPWPLEHELVLEDVVVRHAGRDESALDHVSLRLPARSTTALVGPSGAGKSTCADVLAGLLVPDAGRLVIDGREIAGLDRLRWRHCVAYVTQDVFFVHDTIRRNLCWPDGVHDDAALRSAIDRAAADFVWRLPQGLETLVGDRGSRLSGGERQRLALARALLRSPSLLIVDEVTNALDADSEARIVESLGRLRGHVTILLISHRPAALRLADRRIEIAQGRVRGIA